MTTKVAPAAPLTPAERETLRLIRLDEGWSFRRMADLIGLTESTLQNVLQNEAIEPRETTTFRILKWLEGRAAEAEVEP